MIQTILMLIIQLKSILICLATMITSLNTFYYAALQYFWKGQQTCRQDMFEIGVAFTLGDQVIKEDQIYLYSVIAITSVQLCSRFKTCGPWSNETLGASYVNLKLIELFNIFKKEANTTNCQATAPTLVPIIQNISNTMKVSLIQYLLLAADAYSATTGAQVEASAVVAALVPYVYTCNVVDAVLIYNKVNYGTGETVFISVKAALERNYKCMGVKCSDIGSLQAPAGKYNSSVLQACIDVVETTAPTLSPTMSPTFSPTFSPTQKKCLKNGSRCKKNSRCCSNSCEGLIFKKGFFWKRCK